jgi:hypothetical protein
MTTTSAAHRQASVEEWVDAYSGGDPVGKTAIFSAVSEAISPVLSSFLYMRSKAVFCDKGQEVDRYVRVIRGKGIVSIQFGLTHHAVEAIRSHIFGNGYEFGSHYPCTISMTTTNMGPHSKSWHLPYEVQWPVTGSLGLQLALPEICEFVSDVALPYIEKHRDPEAIRNTYLENPRRADYYARAERIIFAVSILARNGARMEDDYSFLSSRPLPPEDIDLISAAYQSSRHALNAA